ncbi:MAG: hypothetical protein Q8O40_15765, partial [Chloroflexota bacterium]|nr:hypothetical protein [Chloroflexota bacterium]
MPATTMTVFDEGRVAAAVLAGTNTLQCGDGVTLRDWPVNLLAGATYAVVCHGQIRLISTNTADTLTVSTNWTTAIALGETYVIIPLASGPNAGTAGLSYYGVVTAVPGANQFTCPTLTGLGAGKFQPGATQYSAYVLRDAGGLAALPQGETRLVTVYDTATGTFTTTAFPAAVAVGDEILLLHPVLGGGGGGGGMPATAGLWMFGIVSPVQVPSTTVVDIPHLAGFQNDTFNNEFYMEVLNAGGAAPEGQKRLITDYVGATGSFTTDAFTANVEAGDIVAIFHKAIEAIDIIARGTLDTSSATVPADSTRTEGNNHFRGHLLIPTEGTYAGRATRIVQYTGAGGIFIVDPNNPFPGATGLVDYIVTKSQAEFVPAGGGTNNRTPA